MQVSFPTNGVQFRISEIVPEMVHGALGSMMYDPNMFTSNLQQLLSGVLLNAPIVVVSSLTEILLKGKTGIEVG